MPQKIEIDTLVTIDIKRDTRQQIKVLSSLEAQPMWAWLEWMVGKAYEVKMSSQKKHLK